MINLSDVHFIWCISAIPEALIFRPIGMNLVLVRRVGANNLLSMKAERLAAWGPGVAQGPWRGPGVEPRRGSRGRRPRKLLGFSTCKRPRKALLEIFFSLNQPTSASYRNVSIKWHSSFSLKNGWSTILFEIFVYGFVNQNGTYV